MSIRLMTIAWSLHGLSSTDKLVLLSLADNANDDGFCWPSIGTIMAKTSLSERGVQSSLRRLRKRDFVQVMGKPGHSNTFKIMEQEILALDSAPTDKLMSVHKSVNMLHRRGASRAPTPARRAPPPPHDVHPEPSRESSLNLQKGNGALKNASSERNAELERKIKETVRRFSTS